MGIGRAIKRHYHNSVSREMRHVNSQKTENIIKQNKAAQNMCPF